VIIELVAFCAQIPALRDHELEAASRQYRVARQLAESGEDHLILIDPKRASILNGRDLAAPVLWANDLGAESTNELLRMFPERKLWFFDTYDPYDPQDVEGYRELEQLDRPSCWNEP